MEKNDQKSSGDEPALPSDETLYGWAQDLYRTEARPNFHSDTIDFRPFLGHEVVFLFLSGTSIRGYLDRLSDNGKMIVIRREKPAKFSPRTVWESAQGQDNKIGEIHLLASAIAGYYLFSDIPEDVISPNQAAQM